MRVISKRLLQAIVAPGTDKIIAAFPIPSECTLNSVFIDVQLVRNLFAVEAQHAVAYGITGYVLPILDPDGAPTYDAIWDAQVPKDVAAGAGSFDLDTAAADATPEFEWGEPDLTEIMGQGSAPLEVFKRRKLITLAGGSVMSDFTANDWLPTDKFTARIRKPVRVSVPSAFVLGLSSPSLDVTTTTVLTYPTEVQLTQMKYLEVTLEQAWMSLVGLTEAGAETPYEEARTFLAQLLEATVVEETAAYFLASSWNVMCRSTGDITVPGRKRFKTLTGG